MNLAKQFLLMFVLSLSAFGQFQSNDLYKLHGVGDAVISPDGSRDTGRPKEERLFDATERQQSFLFRRFRPV